MARQIIDTETDHGTYKGDPAKDAFNKANDNFQELYERGFAASGTYAARPAAADNKGLGYFATDVQETYISDGVAWRVMPSGGSEIGYAQMGSVFTTTSTTLVDVPGMAVSCRVGERPIVASFGGLMTTSGDFARLYLLCDGVKVANILCPNPAGKNGGFEQYNSRWREARIAGLIPGNSYLFKLQLMVIGTGTAFLYGNAGDGDYAHLQVTTA
ncbi:hypothetical protein [Stenotrophomonas maltophilia]|uniref:hypothetical protein n=1 Tax=Stenotrophomonas maltophilia TaxID=40324 RepID=UPI001F1D7AF2|nr:hypothetical protein [Stenotrophomonas maltophilia]MCF3524540.1 hypothetical protein [Stenotrophomonas maltophilia]MCF3553283.1 hypothetical protein [Stenotrophomonas maltophilia]MCU1054203.1 hypothetical protein [Stenotrophomonas maltophilia]